jgi:hypothetical protein
MKLENWSDENIHFWKSINRTEPDIIIISDNMAAIMIEVKLHSWLSSVDEPDEDYSDRQKKEDEASRNQLARQAALLAESEMFVKCAQRILLLVAPEDSAVHMYKGSYEVVQKAGKGIVEFGFATWQQILDSLVRMNSDSSGSCEKTLNIYQKSILKDLALLLKRKGLESFRGFGDEIIKSGYIDPRLYWKFEDSGGIQLLLCQ